MRVQVRDLVVRFPGQPIPALNGVSLNIEAGERVALLGASGSGKTTLLRCVVAAVRPTSGSVVVGGQDVTHSSAAQRRLRQQTGVVRQRDDLVSGLRAQTNAVLGTSPTWSAREWAQVLTGRVPTRYREPLRILAQRHGIDEHLTSRIEHLSGGQRQRVALVRALLGGPKLLLADEPTSGLDPVTGRAAVDALIGEPGSTVVVSTHDLNIARGFPRVVALRAGHVIFDGPMPDGSQVEAIYQHTGAGA